MKVVDEDVEEGVSMKTLLKKMQGCGLVVWCGADLQFLQRLSFSKEEV